MARSNPAPASAPALPPALVTKLRRRLLAWYGKHKRDLPWRTDPANPYATLVSEAMLQQTQVATVVPYFHRFMKRFPTAQTLAKADEADVLKLWEGLGYYRRARHLHKAAQVLVEDFNGQVPTDLDQILSLPGVGRYTAGAIRSIGHGLPAPIVDGNVERVLARWFAIESDFGDAKARLPLWSLAEQLVPQNRSTSRDAASGAATSGGGGPGDFNQGLMELGATVCSPTQPKCLLCPVADLCQAKAQGRETQLPIKKKRVKPKAVTHTVFAVHRGGKYLVEQRPEGGLWARMWQFVTTEEQADADWLTETFGLKAAATQSLCSFRHQTTHRTIRFEVKRCKSITGRLKTTARPTAQWLTLKKLADLPLANPQKRVLSELQAVQQDL